MRAFTKRIAAAALSAVMSVSLLTAAPMVFAEEDLNGDGVIDVFDYILEKRSAVESTSPISLTLTSEEAAAGETVTIDVGIAENTGCIGINLIMEYSPELIPVTTEDGDDFAVADDTNFKSFRPTISTDTERCTIAYASSRLVTCADNGRLFSATFRVPEDAVPGTSYLLTLRQHDVYDPDFRQVSMLTERGRITVTVPEEPTPEDPEEPAVVTPLVLRGIDISAWQGNVNFANLPEDVSFVMMRAGFGRLASQVDKQFVNNYNKAKAAGMPIGAYWYSYAMTPAEARLEAQACMQVLGNRQFEYPIAFDIEEPKQLALGVTKVSEIITAFCEEMEKAGYYVSVYCSSYYLNHTVNQSVKDKYDVWVAHYNVAKPTYTGAYGMWQYSSTGRVTGISGNVDMDYCYRDYPAIMQRAGLNGY